MADDLKVVLEIGPKGKKVVATAWEWPGLERNGKTGDEALAKLEAYLPRYSKVAARARMKTEFGRPAETRLWSDNRGTRRPIIGVSRGYPAGWIGSRSRMTNGSVVCRCCAHAGQSSMRSLPECRRHCGRARGKGRDRDEIINHVFGNERIQFAKKVGVATPPGVMLTPDGLREHRDAFIDGLREYHVEGKKVGRTWTRSYLLRHAAYHVMDHAWEMEDKDMTDSAG